MKNVAVRVIHLYQKWISPMFPARCKYYPSCSAYAATAISTHGIKGVGMAAWRLMRCNPWSYGGVDYVPTTATRISKQYSATTSNITGSRTPNNSLVSKGEAQ